MRGLLVAVAALALAAPASAQNMNADAMMAQMEAAQAQAQAAARRPGDEALTCEQLQVEFTTVMNDPQYQQSMAAMGAWAQDRQQQMRSGMAKGMAMGGANMAMGLASSFVPGLGLAQQAMMRAQMAGMERQAQQNQQDMVEQAQNAQAMMPTAYRGQRLYELAQAKQCAFLTAPPPNG